MSGEYFSGEPLSKLERDFSKHDPKSEYICDDGDAKFTPKRQDPRLQEIEDQLKMAEVRCNTLIDQVDNMKQIYGCSKPTTKKISNLPTEMKNQERKSSSSSLSDNNQEIIKSGNMKRQNSNAISTDNTGAAVRTINNILSGITDSVNRLSELHVQIAETPRNKSNPNKHKPTMDAEVDVKSSEEAIIQNFEESEVIRDIVIESAAALKSQSAQGIKRKSKDSVNSRKLSTQTLKNRSKIEKKSRATTNKLLDKSSSATLRKKYMNKYMTTRKDATNLVEIYHNTAVKNSDSDESHKVKREYPKQLSNRSKYTEHSIPPLRIPSENPGHSQIMQTIHKIQLKTPTYSTFPPNCANTRYYYDPPEAPRTEVTYYSKNYELPTVASRMKQVAKSYLNTLNFKAIPFCAAISTTPSHNIGINIQQVMNIIKNRQPINGISPTLAHNIGLAAEKLNSKPLTTFVSTINSKISTTRSRCPLSKTVLNYQQMQEMAKGIQEETIDEVDDENADSPEMKTIVITGPSGDVEVTTKNVPQWKLDPNAAEQCTCAPQPNVQFQQVANKYRTNSMITPLPPENSVRQKLARYQNAIRRNRFPLRKSLPNQETMKNRGDSADIREDQQLVVEQTPLQGKEKNLKEVLTNLHDEFEELNKKYEELSQKACGAEENNEALKELERLESELNKKEEEITMVMTLYKEVLALKQQVKHLKEKKSQGSITSVPLESKDTKAKFTEYKNPEAAFHLTKLLRQIQHYQMKYKANFRE